MIQLHLETGHAFWLLPGGGREPQDVDDVAAITREVREEVGLEITVVRQLLDSPAHPDDLRYRRYRTFLCGLPADAEPVTGIRDGIARVSQTRWLPLREVEEWGSEIREDRFLNPQLIGIREALGVTGPSRRAD